MSIQESIGIFHAMIEELRVVHRVLADAKDKVSDVQGSAHAAYGDLSPDSAQQMISAGQMTDQAVSEAQNFVGRYISVIESRIANLQS